MVPSKHYQTYKQNQVSTSSQGKLIIMMYEGAKKFTHMAIEAVDRGDIAAKSLYIQKTHDIINELSVSLNIEKGGDVAVRLESLYQFILNQLTLANIKSDRKALESILKVLSPLLEGWMQLYNETNGSNGAAVRPPMQKSITSKI